MSNIAVFEQALSALVPTLSRQEKVPSAKIFYDIMSGGFVWTDEKVSAVHVNAEQMGCLRALFRFRTSMITGVPDRRFEKLWARAKMLCPQWIGFEEARCAPNETLRIQYNMVNKLGENDTVN